MNRRCDSFLWVQAWGWPGPECIFSVSRGDWFWEVLSIFKFPRSPWELPHFRSEPGKTDLVWPQQLSLFSRQSLALCKGLPWGPRGRSWTAENFIWARVKCCYTLVSSLCPNTLDFFTHWEFSFSVKKNLFLYMSTNKLRKLLSACQLCDTGKERLILEWQ